MYLHDLLFAAPKKPQKIALFHSFRFVEYSWIASDQIAAEEALH
jgi:hypothetical protein